MAAIAPEYFLLNGEIVFVATVPKNLYTAVFI